MKKKVFMTLEFDLVDMTQEEWDDANEGFDVDDDEEYVPEGFVNSVSAYDLEEAVSASLDSRNYPEIFAGTGILAHIENAKIVLTTILPFEKDN